MSLCTYFSWVCLNKLATFVFRLWKRPTKKSEAVTTAPPMASPASPEWDKLEAGKKVAKSKTSSLSKPKSKLVPKSHHQRERKSSEDERGSSRDGQRPFYSDRLSLKQRGCSWGCYSTSEAAFYTSSIWRQSSIKNRIWHVDLASKAKK